MRTIILIAILSLSQLACAHGFDYRNKSLGYYPQTQPVPVIIVSPRIIYPIPTSRSSQRDLKYAIDNKLFERQLRYRIDGRR